jgi:hypothetical protein
MIDGNVESTPSPSARRDLESESMLFAAAARRK